MARLVDETNETGCLIAKQTFHFVSSFRFVLDLSDQNDGRGLSQDVFRQRCYLHTSWTAPTAGASSAQKAPCIRLGEFGSKTLPAGLSSLCYGPNQHMSRVKNMEKWAPYTMEDEPQNDNCE